MIFYYENLESRYCHFVAFLSNHGREQGLAGEVCTASDRVVYRLSIEFILCGLISSVANLHNHIL